MKTSLGFTLTVLIGCAVSPSSANLAPIPVSVSSHNRSSVDVYLLCGDRDAQWLGIVDGKHGAMFEIPTSKAGCLYGLNFFLVHRRMNRGYWVGPIRPRLGSSIHLTVGKYAGLSSARVSSTR